MKTRKTSTKQIIVRFIGTNEPLLKNGELYAIHKVNSNGKYKVGPYALLNPNNKEPRYCTKEFIGQNFEYTEIEVDW